jgi:Coenzyme PQQ synthesis protein D (PqqD)
MTSKQASEVEMGITEAGASRNAMLRARARVPRHVVHRTFPSETVMLNLNTGKYHGLNPTGGRMLAVLAAEGELRAAVDTLAEEFGRPHAEIASDLCDFCAGLVERGLIELVGPEGARG